MLSLINRLNHGYIAIPVIAACIDGGLFELLKEKPVSLDVMTDKLKANKGHFLASLKLLESMEWLAKNEIGEYQLRYKASSYTKIPSNVLELLEFPVEAYLNDLHCAYSLSPWVELSNQRWNIDDEVLPDFLDGLLLVPLLLGLRHCKLYDKADGRILFNNISKNAKTDIASLFLHKQWCEIFGGEISLTDIGKFILDRSMNLGTVASYKPMLKKIKELIFGDAASVFAVDQDGHEGHVERTLNVISSGFQHDRYFKEVEEVILSIFNQLPIEGQPRYVADIGCGDGTFLKRVYNTVLEQSERGKVIDEYPLTLIGVDYNEKALEATTNNLHGINHYVIKGDIGDPAKMERDLQDRDTNVEEILYIRSFLDHDRPFIYPANEEQLENRRALTYESVCVDRDGELIEPAVAVQSLVEHLQRWSSIQSKYGIIILEVHCLSATTISQYLSESENLHFDTYHAFSRQCLNEATVFVMSAAEAGLIPDATFSKKFPKTFPFARITINYFKRKSYQIRNANLWDIPALLKVEALAIPGRLLSTENEIRERIQNYPQGQAVLVYNENIVGVIYSQRVSECQTIIADIDKATWNHEPDAICFELIYAIVSEEKYNTFGRDLIDFMCGYGFLESGVEEISGDSRCRKYLEYSAIISAKNFGFSSYIDKYIKSYDIRKEDDTLHAELTLEAFGAKWLLRVFQEMGVLKKAGENYASGNDLARQLKISEKYYRLFDSIMGIFERNKLLSIDTSGVITKGPIEHFALLDIEKDIPVFERDFKGNYPSSTAFLNLMVRCLENYGEVLVGNVEANDVVFPGGSMDLFAGIFKGNKVADYFNNLVAEIIFKRIQDLRNSSSLEKVTILEIGAGTGGTTKFVLERIKGIATNVTYFYTDISSTFTRYGCSMLGEKYPWVKFERLNIEEDPQLQGFESYSFDIIFESNVIHDTKQLDITFAQIKKLLKKDGLLILNEYTVMKDILLYTGGLLHGWWLFEDPEHRLENSCLLSIDKWQTILKMNGFKEIQAYGLPFEFDLDKSRQGVIFCENNQVPLEERSPEESIQDNSHLNLVRDCMQLILGEKRLARFAPEIPLMELGFDSLELLELREMLSKKLGAKLSAPFLFQCNTAAKIADFFQQQRALQKVDSGMVGDIQPSLDTAALLLVKKSMQTILGEKRLARFAPEIPLMELGFDSLELLELREMLSKKLGAKLSAPFLFQCNTAAKIAKFIQDESLLAGNESKGWQQKHSTLTLDHRDIAEEKSQVRSVIKRQYNNHDIAVIGVSLRFPGGIDNTEKFWELLKEGRSAVGLMPRERWNWPPEVDVKNEKSYLLKGGFLDRIDEFDADFFRISPKEAELMDPQQRMLLELSWEVMEDAGYKPSVLCGSDTGVYIGACHFEYRKLLEENDSARDAYFATGTSGSILANRVSYFYDFQGPSVMLDSACSSSLVAIHEAVRAIRGGGCKKALVGGANLICSSVNVLSYDEAGMLSRDGKCYTFDGRANGFVRGEGVGIVFLKNMEDAVKDNDHIYAVIKGSAVNHGGQASSLTAPNPNLQAQLICNAIADAKVPVESIGYIEAHGTGTSLGDPIEAEGLKLAFLDKQGQGTGQGYCGIGSVKSNLGHLEGAAGIAGLIKTVLSLQHKTIPATINYQRLNPEMDLLPAFYIADKTREWKANLDGQGNLLPRRAGVSAFGFGGANAHVILEEYLNDIPVQDFSGHYVFVLSAKNKKQLHCYAEKFSTFLSQDLNNNEFSAANMCNTLQVAREAMKERLAIVFSGIEQLREKLLWNFVSDQPAGLYHSTVGVPDSEISHFNEGSVGKRLVEAMLKNKELDRLAALWTKGVNVDWSRLYGSVFPKRINLPKYPFAKESYWLPERIVNASDFYRSQIHESIIHPLVHKNTSDFSGQRFSSVFTGQEFFLRDHVVNGQKILPGVAYLEMVREAFSQSFVMSRGSTARVSLKNIVWTQPIVIDDQPVPVQIRLFPESNGEASYEIYTESATVGVKSAVHSQGTAILQVSSEVPCRNLTLLKDQCNYHYIDFEKCYQAFDAMGIKYGLGHKGIEGIYVGEEHVLAKLFLPSSVAETVNQYVLHPSLLDSALQATFASMIVSSDLKPLLPFAMDEMEVLGECMLDMWAIVTRAERGSGIQKFDIDLCDIHGNVCVRMKGYAPRSLEKRLSVDTGLNSISIDKTNASRAEIFMLTPVWDDVYFNGKDVFPLASEKVVIIGGSKDEQDAVLGNYPQASILDVSYFDSIEAIAEKMEAHGVVEHIVWIAPHSQLSSLVEESLINDQQQGVFLGFRIIKALLRLEYDAKDLGWTVITVQAQPIYKGEKVNPTHISIHGLIGSMAKEYLNWKVRLVDLDENREWPLHAIFSLPPDPSGNALAYRNLQWYKQQLIPTQMPSVDNSLYRVGGVYVVIGGAGGIGESWSESMIRNYQAQIVWIGRRLEDDSIRESLDTLALLGPRPLYISADATDRNAMEFAYQEIKQKLTHINGIIHSALVLLDHSLVNTDEERFRAGLAAKVDVCVRMAQVFGRESLDFVMFFSSISAFSKVAGQSNYASGCVFKDAFANQLAREWSCAVKVMNWGYWGSVGIVASQEYRERMEKSGIGSIEPLEAMEGLDKLLVGEIDQAALFKSVEVAYQI